MRFLVFTLGLAFAASALASAPEETLKDLPQVRFPEPHRVVSGTINEIHLEAIKAVGIRHVVSLRPAEENPSFDEPSVVAAHGLQFHAIPIKGPQSLTRENARALDEVFRQIGDESTLLHCSTGNRVGALIALREAWIKGRPTEEAIAIGKQWGLAALESAVRNTLNGSNVSP